MEYAVKGVSVFLFGGWGMVGVELEKATSVIKDDEENMNN